MGLDPLSDTFYVADLGLTHHRSVKFVGVGFSAAATVVSLV